MVDTPERDPLVQMNPDHHPMCASKYHRTVWRNGVPTCGPRYKCDCAAINRAEVVRRAEEEKHAN